MLGIGESSHVIYFSHRKNFDVFWFLCGRTSLVGPQFLSFGVVSFLVALDMTRMLRDFLDLALKVGNLVGDEIPFIWSTPQGTLVCESGEAKELERSLIDNWCPFTAVSIHARGQNVFHNIATNSCHVQLL